MLLVYEGDILTYPQSPCSKCLNFYKECFVQISGLNPRHSAIHKVNGTITHNAKINGYISADTSLFTDQELLSNMQEFFLQGINCEVCDRMTDIRMIDFAHVFKSDTVDEHYLHGLSNLIGYFLQYLCELSEKS